jgi:TrmH family RNA methyltransferase
MKLQKYKRDSELSYAMGATLVAELLKTQPKAIRRVFLRPVEKHGDDLEKILTDLKLKNIEIVESTKAFNILGAKDNCLLMAEFAKDIANSYFNVDEGPTRVILVNPSDSGNLGTIMRSAVAFGYTTLEIVMPGVDPYDPKVIRASMGAVFHLNIKIVSDITKLKVDKNCLAFVLDDKAVSLESINAETYRNCPPDLIFGNEAAGLPKDFCQKTGATPVDIRQSENVDSLNLGVAASIAMHYFSVV